MRIAITARGPDLSSEVDSRFGRAKCFIIHDTESGVSETVDNEQNLNAAQGAGIQAAENVARRRVEALLTGNCGPKAFRVLSAAGVAVYANVEGTVQEAIEKFKSGDLQPTQEANVQSHWM